MFQRWGSTLEFISGLVEKWEDCARAWGEEVSESPDYSQIVMRGFEPASGVFQMARTASGFARLLCPLIKASEASCAKADLFLMLTRFFQNSPSNLCEDFHASTHEAICNIRARIVEASDSRMMFALETLNGIAMLTPSLCALSLVHLPEQCPFHHVRQGMWLEYIQDARAHDIRRYLRLSEEEPFTELGGETDWWTEMKQLRFPDLYRQVVRLRATSISNASIERTFAIAKHRVKHERARLAVDSIRGETNVVLSLARRGIATVSIIISGVC
jgi:hypothetical protein